MTLIPAAAPAGPLAREAHAATVMARLCELDIVPLGPIEEGSPVQIDAVFGSPATESSFKSILGLGLLMLARERGELAEGGTVIESTSGSLGAGLAAAGRLLGHPIVLVSDVNMPRVTQRKIELLGATLHLVGRPHPDGGFQRSRDDLVRSLLGAHPDWYWTRQNDSPLNPETYRRFLIPRLLPKIAARDYSAGIFCVGSGGHFSAFSEALNSLGIPAIVADREGSTTFGGAPKPSRIRGSGNQHGVPEVIAAAMGRVKGVFEVAEVDAYAAVRDLARRGVHVGPSSGVCWSGARQLADTLNEGRILTFFPDRGELYGPELLENPDDAD